MSETRARELVPVPQDGQSASLWAVREEKYKAALTNFVVGSTPRDVIFQRPARGGTSVDYVPGWWFIEQANALFHHLWDHDVIEVGIGQEQVWSKNRVTVKVPGSTVIEHLPDGRVVETRYDPIEVSKTQFGSSEIKKYTERSEKAGKIIDIGDDLKASATDGMKKCFAEFGFAPDVYGRREVIEESGPGKAQLAALYKVGRSKNLGKEEVDDVCVAKYGRPPRELETILVLGLIQDLRSRK